MLLPVHVEKLLVSVHESDAEIYGTLINCPNSAYTSLKPFQMHFLRITELDLQ